MYQYESIELYLHSVPVVTPSLFLSLKEPDLVPQTQKKSQVLVTRTELRSFLELPINPDPTLQNMVVQNYTPSQIQQVCVQGHNKSDRAEAILFHVIRGAGMNGLSTLQWKQIFASSIHSNDTFYPRFSDFFHEVRVISLDSLFFHNCLKKNLKKKASLAYLYNNFLFFKRPHQQNRNFYDESVQTRLLSIGWEGYTYSQYCRKRCERDKKQRQISSSAVACKQASKH